MKVGTPFFVIWLALIFSGMIALHFNFRLHWAIDLALSINVATFLLYGIDKFQATQRGWRVPERVLYLMTFLGGSAGALAGMWAFRHKTSKISFQFVVAFLILVQFLVFYGLYRLLSDNPF